MKKIVIVILAALLLVGCGSGKQTDTSVPESAEKTEKPADQITDSKGESIFEDQIIAISEKNGVGYSFHQHEYAEVGLSDPGVTSRFMLCDMIDGERSGSFQIITEYFEDPAYAKEQFELVKNFVGNGIGYPTIALLDDDRTIATCLEFSDHNGNLMYAKLYDHYVITVVAIPDEYYDAAYAIMEEIEALTNQ